MLSISIDVVDLVKFIQERKSEHPDSILDEAKKLSSNPKEACRRYLTYLSLVGTQRKSKGIVPAVNHLFAQCLNRMSLNPNEFILRGDAKIEGESVVLKDQESAHSRAVIQQEIGERFLWGIRYRFSIEDGVEAKISVADMTFAICTEDHPVGKSRVFLYDRERNTFRAILQESHLVARKGYPLLATLLLLDHDVWYVVDDKTVFAIKLSGDDREKWRKAQPQFGTWRSRRVRIKDVAVFEL